MNSVTRTASRLFSSSRRCKGVSPLVSALQRGAPIDVHPEVKDALSLNRPVVALETAITTHGLPYPVNRDTALALERIVRSTGSVPATIGLINGRVKIGLEGPDLERLAHPDRNSSVVKISRRDIAAAISTKKDGGTTISSTLVFAALAGIKVLATGGLGGVHRGGEHSLDISADLPELSRCPVGLVSAGVKSILDVSRTLEYLETLGIPVVSYSKTNDFPAFFYSRSGFKSPWMVDDPQTAAKILFTQQQLGMNNAVFFAVPIPEEHDEVGQMLKEKVEQAIVESEMNGMSQRGKDATPWLLRRVVELSQGQSINSNVALIENAALVGGRIAAEYSQLITSHAGAQGAPLHPLNDVNSRAAPHSIQGRQHKPSLPPARALVLGSAAVDISAMGQTIAGANPSTSVHSTTPGVVSLSLGGVGRNIAEACHRIISTRSPVLQSATMLVSLVGNDPFGKLLREETQQLGMRVDGLVESDKRSAVCNIVLDSVGGLIGGVADMDIIHSLDSRTVLEQIEKHRPGLVALDGNLSEDTIRAVVKHCYAQDTEVFFEPTSIPRSASVFPAVAAILDELDPSRSPVTFTSPNMLELAHMYAAASAEPFTLTSHNSWWKTIDAFSLGAEFRMDLEQLARQRASEHDSTRGSLSFLVEKGLAQMALHLLPFFQNIFIKCGDLGVIVAMRISGPAVQTSGWAERHSDARNRCVIGRSGGGQELIVFKHFPAFTLAQGAVVNVTGAGDSFVGSLLASLLLNPVALHPKSLSQTIHSAQRAAVLTLQSSRAVSPKLSSDECGDVVEHA